MSIEQILSQYGVNAVVLLCALYACRIIYTHMRNDILRLDARVVKLEQQRLEDERDRADKVTSAMNRIAKAFEGRRCLAGLDPRESTSTFERNLKER